MKRAPLSKTLFLANLTSQTSDDELPERMGPAGRASQIERLAAQEGLLQAVRLHKVFLHCHGCDDQINAFEDDWAACVCGGFICAPCCRLETDGVCAHDPLEPPADWPDAS